MNIPCRNQKGFTLIEMLIALGLSLVVIGAAIGVFNYSQNSYNVQEDIAAMQDGLGTGNLALARSVDHFQDLDPQRIAQPGLGQSHSVEGGVRWQTDRKQMLLELVYLRKIARVGSRRTMLVSIGQEFASQSQHVDDSERQDCRANRCEVEK